jgi:hypothetical protein
LLELLAFYVLTSHTQKLTILLMKSFLSTTKQNKKKFYVNHNEWIRSLVSSGCTYEQAITAFIQECQNDDGFEATVLSTTRKGVARDEDISYDPPNSSSSFFFASDTRTSPKTMDSKHCVQGSVYHRQHEVIQFVVVYKFSHIYPSFNSSAHILLVQRDNKI